MYHAETLHLLEYSGIALFSSNLTVSMLWGVGSTRQQNASTTTTHPHSRDSPPIQPSAPAGVAGAPFSAASAKPAGLSGGRPGRDDGQAVQCLRRVRDVPPPADHPPGPAHLRRHPRQGQRHATCLAQRISLIFTAGSSFRYYTKILHVVSPNSDQ